MRGASLTWANIFRSRFDFESAATAILYGPHILYEPYKAGCEHGLRYKQHPASGEYLQLGGTIPLLENDRAVPLEFIHYLAHLLGKYSSTVARFRRTARRPDGAVDLFASSRAGILQIRQ
jgi:hypothetical protein